MLNISGTQLHYIRKGSGTPVVMIHGSYSSSNIFSMSIFGRTAECHDAIAFDLPGFGNSPRKKENLPLKERAGIIHRAIQALGISNPVLVGHSTGGTLALRYAMDYPDASSSLVLIAPYIEPYEKSHIFYRTVTMPVIGDLFFYGFLKPLKLFKEDTVFLRRSFYPAEPNKEYARAEVALASRRMSFRASAKDIQNLGPELQSMTGHYAQVRIPVTIIAGKSDVVAPFERNARVLHTKIPHSQLIALPETGHTPMFTQSEEVLKAIDDAAFTANAGAGVRHAG